MTQTQSMESQFFQLEHTQKKAVQLLQISKLLAGPVTLKFHIGDTNLTGGYQLSHENQAISEAGLVDMWAKLTPGFNPAESQENPNFQQRDATWRSPENPVIRELQAISYEHHRPDRVLMTRDSLAAVDQASTTMTLLRENWSDYDGLLFQLSLQ